MSDAPANIKLTDLGKRICIIGPSSSGKSTLCAKLSNKLDVPAVHLDQYRHQPNTNWALREYADFEADHDKTIEQNSWVLDGNYSKCMPQRFAAATSVIWLDPFLLGCVYRYICRCLKGEAKRAGNLEGATGQFNIELIRFMLFQYPKNKDKYQHFLKDFRGTFVHIKSMKELDAYCKQWGLH